MHFVAPGVLQSESPTHVTQPSVGEHFSGATHPKPPSAPQSGFSVDTSAGASVPPPSFGGFVEPSPVGVVPSAVAPSRLPSPAITSSPASSPQAVATIPAHAPVE